MTNRFKGLDLVDRVPEEVWMEVPNTVQEAVTKITPKRKKMQEGKIIVWGDYTIAKEREEVKGKGEWEWHTQLSAEVWRRAKRDGGLL